MYHKLSMVKFILQMKERNIGVYILLSLAMLIWGITYVWVEMAIEYITPKTLAGFRVVIAVSFLLLLSLVLKKLQRPKLKDLKIFALFALIDPFAYFLCESYGLMYSSPTTAAVIIATIPLLTPISALIVLGEKVTRSNVIGILVSFMGVLLVILNKDFKLAVAPLGLILLGSAVILTILYNFFLRNLTAKYNVYTVLSVQNIFAFIYFIPILLIYGPKELEAITITSELVSVIFALGILGSAVAFIFYAAGIKTLGITKGNVFVNLIPVFTAFFAYFYSDETMTGMKMAGVGLVIAGLFLSQVKSRRLKKG